MSDKSFVTQQLENAAGIFQQRYELYGDNYKRFGPMMAALFPDGLTLKTPEDFGRFGIFVQVVSKLTRYGNMFTAGGHPDSLDDTSVYAQMLQELDHDAKQGAAPDTVVIATPTVEVPDSLQVNWDALHETGEDTSEPAVPEAEILDDAPASEPPKVLA